MMSAPIITFTGVLGLDALSQYVYLTKKQPDMVPEPLKHYADPNDYNRIFYHQRNDDMEAIIQTLLADSDCLLELCKTDFEETTEYQLFVRCLSDQTVVENDKRRLRTKDIRVCVML